VILIIALRKRQFLLELSVSGNSQNYNTLLRCVVWNRKWARLRAWDWFFTCLQYRRTYSFPAERREFCCSTGCDMRLVTRQLLGLSSITRLPT